VTTLDVGRTCKALTLKVGVSCTEATSKEKVSFTVLPILLGDCIGQVVWTARSPKPTEKYRPAAIFVADAHRGDGNRFVVRADEKLTAFVELESATRGLPPSHL
jgi:hypothetical protein